MWPVQTSPCLRNVAADVDNVSVFLKCPVAFLRNDICCVLGPFLDHRFLLVLNSHRSRLRRWSLQSSLHIQEPHQVLPATTTSTAAGKSKCQAVCCLDGWLLPAAWLLQLSTATNDLFMLTLFNQERRIKKTNKNTPTNDQPLLKIYTF